jgi:hypothetical protein
MIKYAITLATIFLVSCTITSSYYQVFKAIPENGTITKDQIVFEDMNCKVAYNLWGADGGDIGFGIYNKTDEDIILDLTKTFFILNGVAYDYFQNSSTTKSNTSGTTLTSYNYPYYYNYWSRSSSRFSGTSSTTFSNTYVEKPQLIIPSKTQRVISEFRVAKSRYLNCDLLKAPSARKVKTLQFEKSNSPFVFYNLISYRTSKDSARMENKFYVTEITNRPASQMFISVDTNSCGKSLNIPETIFRDVRPDKFYFRYSVEK